MKITEVIEEADILPDRGLTPNPCQGSSFHSPTPLGTHAVHRGSVDGDPGPHAVGTQIIYLCGTCRANLRIFLSLMTNSNGALPWEVRRQFGNTIRMLGQSIWSEYHEEDEAASG